MEFYDIFYLECKSKASWGMDFQIKRMLLNMYVYTLGLDQQEKGRLLMSTTAASVFNLSTDTCLCVQ